jgi:hypothetical protein
MVLPIAHLAHGDRAISAPWSWAHAAHRERCGVRTKMTLTGRGVPDWQGTEERFAALAMMGRIGEPEDIANAVVSWLHRS